MSVLQWALLIVGAVAVVAVYLLSRRSSRLPNDWEPPSARSDVPRVRAAGGAGQLDMFGQGGAAAGAVRTGEFDEFGVGRPRRRVAPELSAQSAPQLSPEGAAAATELGKPREEKIVTLLIAEREGTSILGQKIHAALQAHGLAFGEHRIYHRLQDGKAVFSVANLVKPGVLDPAEQQQFSTPGLAVFMVLPGPVRPQLALQDMLSTTQALAQALNAEVYDERRQRFTPDSARQLQADVDAWVQRHGL